MSSICLKKPAWCIKLVVLLILGITGCLVDNDSPALGCNKNIGCGGCFGKTAIIDFSVEPEIPGLTFDVNNCNGGSVSVDNKCDDTLVLGAARIAPKEHKTMGLVADGDSCVLMETEHFYSQFIPETDKQIDLVGTVGEQQIRVTFIQTAKLCD